MCVCPRTQVCLCLSVPVPRYILVSLSMCPGVFWSVCQCIQVYLGLSVNVSRCFWVCLSMYPGVSWSVNVSRCILVCQCVQVFLGLSVNVSRCILALYGLVNNCSTNNEGSDVNTPSFHLVIAIADILNILNSCLNIVVYCLTGTRFRREVKQLLLCRSCFTSYLLFCLPGQLTQSLTALQTFCVRCCLQCLTLSPLPARSLPLLCTLCSLLVCVCACVRACVRARARAMFAQIFSVYLRMACNDVLL